VIIEYKEKNMGDVHAEIRLVNVEVRIKFRNGLIEGQAIRHSKVRALVDTGTRTLVISETIRQELGLVFEGTRNVGLADGSRKIYPVTEALYILWTNRITTCRALVIPNLPTVLLGVIPLEDMDLIVDPVRQELAGAHGDEVFHFLGGIQL
jgi:clan AA aspartic protease